MLAPFDRQIAVLSPHLDDATLSCGGLLLQQPDAEVVTVFSGDPPRSRPKALAHLALPSTRRQEDAVAMRRLGCSSRFLGHIDAIDRLSASGERLYPRLPSIFGAVSPADAPLCQEIANTMDGLLGDRLLLCPMAVGAHVDHQICAHVGRKLIAKGREVMFYEDVPYVYPRLGVEQGDSVLLAAGRMRARIVGYEDIAIDAEQKQALVGEYATQVTALFGDLACYRNAAASHYEVLGGPMERIYRLDVLGRSRTLRGRLS